MKHVGMFNVLFFQVRLLLTMCIKPRDNNFHVRIAISLLHLILRLTNFSKKILKGSVGWLARQQVGFSLGDYFRSRPFRSQTAFPCFHSRMWKLFLAVLLISLTVTCAVGTCPLGYFCIQGNIPAKWHANLGEQAMQTFNSDDSDRPGDAKRFLTARRNFLQKAVVNNDKEYQKQSAQNGEKNTFTNVL